MNDIILNGLITVGVSTIGSIVAYKAGRNKEKADIRQTEANAQTTELDATEKAVAIWRGLAQDLKKEVDELRALINDLRLENDKLRQELEHLKGELTHDR